jgi:hypothetical protein
MPTVRRPSSVPVHYGESVGFNWVNDPFSDPLERLKRKKKQVADSKYYYTKKRKNSSATLE